MPNHVTTIIQATPEVITAMLDEKGNVDFNRIIPAPDHTDPVFTSERVEYPGGMVGYGSDGYSPLDWATENWGTKWNAYDVEYDARRPDHVQFDTAWCHPEPVINALAARFPDVAINVAYADEDMGYNCGAYGIHGATVVTLFDENEQSRETAREFACQVKYGMSLADLEEENEYEPEDRTDLSAIDTYKAAKALSMLGV